MISCMLISSGQIDCKVLSKDKALIALHPLKVPGRIDSLTEMEYDFDVNVVVTLQTICIQLKMITIIIINQEFIW